MRIPILAYHSMFMDGRDCADNDHVALAADLDVITAAGFRIEPLHALVDAWLRDPSSLDGERIVALTCDDGSDFDYRDLEHPTLGMQRSFVNVMRDFQARRPGAQPNLHMTSFVIVSPQARDELDRTCMVGKGWWNEDWWRDAVASNVMGIASHSWDHNHDTLASRDFPAVARGTFSSIDTWELAEHQVRRAAEYLWQRAPNPSARIFAYPYGERSDYLVKEYLPGNAASLRLDAAVGASARPWTKDSDRWELPRFVHAQDWKEPAELGRLLREHGA